MKEKNGQGKFFFDPPEDFIPKKVSNYKIIETAENENHFCTKCQETFSGDFILKNHMIEKHTHERRQAFVSECFEDVQQHMDYKEWEKIITVIYNVTFASHKELSLYIKESHEETQHKLFKTNFELEKTKEDNLKLFKENIQPDDTSEETFKIIRQRSSGPNFVET